MTTLVNLPDPVTVMPPPHLQDQIILRLAAALHLVVVAVDDNMERTTTCATAATFSK